MLQPLQQLQLFVFCEHLDITQIVHNFLNTLLKLIFKIHNFKNLVIKIFCFVCSSMMEVWARKRWEWWWFDLATQVNVIKKWWNDVICPKQPARWFDWSRAETRNLRRKIAYPVCINMMTQPQNWTGDRILFWSSSIRINYHSQKSYKMLCPFECCQSIMIGS